MIYSLIYSKKIKLIFTLTFCSLFFIYHWTIIFQNCRLLPIGRRRRIFLSIPFRFRFLHNSLATILLILNRKKAKRDPLFSCCYSATFNGAGISYAHDQRGGPRKRRFPTRIVRYPPIHRENGRREKAGRGEGAGKKGLVDDSTGLDFAGSDFIGRLSNLYPSRSIFSCKSWEIAGLELCILEIVNNNPSSLIWLNVTSSLFFSLLFFSLEFLSLSLSLYTRWSVFERHHRALVPFSRQSSQPWSNRVIQKPLGSLVFPLPPLFPRFSTRTNSLKMKIRIQRLNFVLFLSFLSIFWYVLEKNMITMVIDMED